MGTISIHSNEVGASQSYIVHGIIIIICLYNCRRVCPMRDESDESQQSLQAVYCT